MTDPAIQISTIAFIVYKTIGYLFSIESGKLRSDHGETALTDSSGLDELKIFIKRNSDAQNWSQALKTLKNW